jgi:hypothetical protein
MSIETYIQGKKALVSSIESGSGRNATEELKKNGYVCIRELIFQDDTKEIWSRGWENAYVIYGAKFNYTIYHNVVFTYITALVEIETETDDEGLVRFAPIRIVGFMPANVKVNRKNIYQCHVQHGSDQHFVIVESLKIGEFIPYIGKTLIFNKDLEFVRMTNS